MITAKEEKLISTTLIHCVRHFMMLTLLLIFIYLALTQNIEASIYKKHNGYKLLGEPFLEIESATSLTCTANCDSNDQCHGVNYILSSLTGRWHCQLFYFYGIEENLIADHESVYIEKGKYFSMKEFRLTELPCDQKDFYEVEGKRFNCTHAIDGLKGEFECWGAEVCFHSYSSADPWMQIDFETERTLAMVKLYNRINLPEHLDGFTIQVQDQSMPNQSHSQSCVENVPYAKELVRTLVCDKLVTGRYLVIRKGVSNGELVLVEVLAFGY